LLRQVDAIFVAKALVPPNLAYRQSGRFVFVVSADLDNPGGHLTIPSPHLDAFAAPP
jgi:hypothetical protein